MGSVQLYNLPLHLFKVCACTHMHVCVCVCVCNSVGLHLPCYTFDPFIGLVSSDERTTQRNIIYFVSPCTILTTYAWRMFQTLSWYDITMTIIKRNTKNISFKMTNKGEGSMLPVLNWIPHHEDLAEWRHSSIYS